ncbi:MAG: hypothetical protein WBA53_08340 [Burkholderiaceae bacterium]
MCAPCLLAACAADSTPSHGTHGSELDPITAQHLAADLARDPRTRAGVKARLGEANVVRFASGYEVWAYRIAAAAKQGGQSPHRGESERDARGELVILFTPAGDLATVRTRIPTAYD